MIADLVEALSPVTDTFEAHGVPYFIGGSVASSAYGAVRATMDVDLVAQFPASLAAPFAAALRDRYYVDAEAIREAAVSHHSFNLVHFSSALKLDVFCVLMGAYEQAVFSRLQYKSIDASRPDETFPFASPEDVLLSKLVWYERGARQANQQLVDVCGIIRVQRNLDRGYIDEWAQFLDVSELVRRVFV